MEPEQSTTAFAHTPASSGSAARRQTNGRALTARRSQSPFCSTGPQWCEDRQSASCLQCCSVGGHRDLQRSISSFSFRGGAILFSGRSRGWFLANVLFPIKLSGCRPSNILEFRGRKALLERLWLSRVQGRCARSTQFFQHVIRSLIWNSFCGRRWIAHGPDTGDSLTPVRAFRMNCCTAASVHCKWWGVWPVLYTDCCGVFKFN